ncbi:MAG TPA: SLC13 family permease [Gemmatimonadales bacterium]
MLFAGQEGVLRSTTDPLSQGLVAAIIVLVFVVLALEKAHRVLVIFSAVAALWLITYLTPFKLITFEGAKTAIDLNVLFLLAAMMAAVGVLKTTGVFEWAVGRLLQQAGGRPIVIQALIAWFTGILSAFADNVTTVIFVTPMALEMARLTGVRPLAYLLPMVMAANIGGTATLIGDPPNIMIGSGANLSFLDFIYDLSVPVLWMMLLLEFFSRRWYRADFASAIAMGGSFPQPEVQDPQLLRWSLGITGGIFIGFFTHSWTGMPVAVPAVIGAAAILIVQDVLYLRRHRPSHAERVHGLLEVIEKEIEWPTLSFFAFLFIAVGAAVDTGLIDTMATGLAWLIGTGQASFGLSAQGTLLFGALMICWASGVLSALIDNIPFVAVAIPIVARLTGTLEGNTEVLWWALSLGACLGGNGSAIGASANVTTIGLSERGGTRISFAEFTRFGAIVAALTLLVASLFLGGYVYLGDQRVFRLGLGGLAVIAIARAVLRR